MNVIPPSLAALEGLSDADTLEVLSQDSGSTLSATPPLLDDIPQEGTPECVNAEEEQVRRRIRHAPATMPELRPANVARSAEASQPVRGASSTSEEPVGVLLRWHLNARSLFPSESHRWSTPWVPFTIGRPALFPYADATTFVESNTLNTFLSTSSALEGAANVNKTRRSGSALLLLGRATLIECVRGCPEAPEGELVREAAEAVAREHCTVHVHFAASPSPTHDAPQQSLAPRCRSCDIFALSAATSLNGVPLHPHHRYHLQSNKFAGDTAGMLTLRLGPQCSVDVALSGIPVSTALPPPPQHLTTGVVTSFPDSPANLLLNRRGADRLSLHGDGQRSSVPDRGGGTTTTVKGGSTTSLLTDDSTAVLATQSGVSEPVALSDQDDGTTDDAPALCSPSPTSVAATRRPKRKSTAAATAATAAKRPRKSTASNAAEHEEHAVTAPPPVLAAGTTVLYTTGLRLSDGDEESLKALGALVNPHLRYAPHATVLVAQRPLMRSVKLLTVLPFVQEVVQEGWLRTVLHTHTLDIATESFAYSERTLPDSIEGLNAFDLRETLRHQPADRQRLFAGQCFWVHATAAPQDPPLNDLRTVLTASGGAVTRDVSAATVLVMPQRRPALRMWKPLLAEVGGLARLTQRRASGLLLVVPDDVFKCVLQQRPLVQSSVPIPRKQLSEDADGVGGVSSGRSSHAAGRASAGKARNTQRNTTSQRSPRPNKR